MEAVVKETNQFQNRDVLARVRTAATWGVRYLVAAILVFSAWQKFSAGQALWLPVLESCLAMWLLSGQRTKLAFVAVAILFSGFAGVHVHSLLASQASCKCMGDLEISSKLMLLLTVAVVVTAVFLIGINDRKLRPLVEWHCRGIASAQRDLLADGRFL